jgi:hypothetical protein
VTRANVQTLQRLNFGLRARQEPLEPGYLATQVSQYSGPDAEAVPRHIRATADRDTAIDALLALYEEVIEEQRAAVGSPEEELRVAADYLGRIGLAQHRADGVKTAGLELGRALDAAARRWPIVRGLGRSPRVVRWTAAARRHWGTVD